MKKLLKRITILTSFVMLLMAIAFPPQAKAQGGDVSYQTFYDDLSPYGQWVTDPSYGNVWVPNAGSDFQPYNTNGHWAMTDYGNTWVSDYAWGWAPFHYGRWTYDTYYGWVWVPGYDWGPAWVSWRNGGGYYGWAPLSPGISIGVAVGGYNCPGDWWVFVGPQYLYRSNWHSYWRGPRYNTTIIRNTAFVNNTYARGGATYVSGPRAADVQRITHQAVPTYKLGAASRPGKAALSGHSLNIYRPAVNRATINSARPKNAVRAPQAIGHPQAATANKQPAFHSTMQKQAPNMRPAAAPAQRPTAPNNRANNAAQQNVHPVRPNTPRQPAQPQPQHNRPQQQMNKPQRQVNRPQQQMNRPQQQMNRPQQPVNRPMQAPSPRPQPQPHMQAPQQHMQAPQQHMAPPHEEGGGRR
jgi:hypothetical protein